LGVWIFADGPFSAAAEQAAGAFASSTAKIGAAKISTANISVEGIRAARGVASQADVRRAVEIEIVHVPLRGIMRALQERSGDVLCALLKRLHSPIFLIAATAVKVPPVAHGIARDMRTE
jgi:hypothetical protein